MSGQIPTTERTRLRRMPKRGSFDRQTIYSILDAMPLCHVGYLIDGKPVVTPTFQWREGDHVYWHGSRAGRGPQAAAGSDVCLTVSLIDGFVLARSAMHHSTNYRSVMVFGRPTVIDDADLKIEKLERFVETLYPGRWETLRPLTAQEAKATTVLSMPIEEASAKVRAGGPMDDEADYALPIWAGVIPVRYEIGEPQADPRNLHGVEAPPHARAFSIGGRDG